MLVDTHCHLDFSPLADDLDGVLSRARDAGVGAIVAPSYDVTSWARVAAIGESAGVYVAFGVHPWVASKAFDSAELERRLRAEKAVAIGEIGLDSKVDSVPLVRQREVLVAQLELAVDLDLPVMLHCRGAFGDLLGLIKRYAPRLRGVVHAFSRGPELAEQFVALGLMIAFGGTLTRHNANRARRAAEWAPRDAVVLETDAPSIGVAGVSAENTEPRHLVDVAQALADAKGLSLDEIARMTTANAQRLFSIA
jgi:TatD DNase family protein